MLDPHDLPFPARVAPDATAAARITWDSREAGPDTAFAALTGETTHGNAFVNDALLRGAPFVLTDQDVPRAVRVEDATRALRAWGRAARNRFAQPVVGITGSVGKTTAKTYVGAALNARFMPVFNTLNAIACFLLNEQNASVPLVVEMGIDRVGEMRELMNLVAPDVGVVTAIGEAHLQAFGTVDVIAREKGVILEAPRALVSVQASRWFPGVPSYGFDGATHAGRDLTLSAEGAAFTFEGVRVAVPGGRAVEAEAAVLGMTLASWLGAPLATAAERIRTAERPTGRYRVHEGPVTVIDDCYNASPLSMRAALDALAARAGRKVAVLGDMLELGPASPDLHAEVGAYARRAADVTFGVGEFAELLGAHAFADRDALLPAVLSEVRPGDVVLVKASRGVGLERIVQALLERRRALV